MGGRLTRNCWTFLRFILFINWILGLMLARTRWASWWAYWELTGGGLMIARAEGALITINDLSSFNHRWCQNHSLNSFPFFSWKTSLRLQIDTGWSNWSWTTSCWHGIKSCRTWVTRLLVIFPPISLVVKTVVRHGCQIATSRFLDHMCLALRVSGLWLRCKIWSLPFLGLRPHALHPGAIQGKEGIKFYSVA